MGLLSACFWVLISFTENEDNHHHNNNASNNPTAAEFRLIGILVRNEDQQLGITSKENDSVENDKNTTTKDTDPELRALQIKFIYAWNAIYPYFQGACGLAMILGLIQILICMIILTSSTK